ncbi:hypothetical protein OIU84_025694 [Salix udensis]|uniref:Uncharacterized protein n=1 Tax=Salix udensis TaxID=889485 RepID=A0AAD6KME7_9ROSI|nr:hypothetical protein OIU84_025694 [Salix udensis]
MSTGCLVIIKSVKYPFLDCFMTADVAFYSVNRHLRFIQPDDVENIGGYWNMRFRVVFRFIYCPRNAVLTSVSAAVIPVLPRNAVLTSVSAAVIPAAYDW